MTGVNKEVYVVESKAGYLYQLGTIVCGVGQWHLQLLSTSTTTDSSKRLSLKGRHARTYDG